MQTPSWIWFVFDFLQKALIAAQFVWFKQNNFLKYEIQENKTPTWFRIDSRYLKIGSESRLELAGRNSTGLSGVQTTQARYLTHTSQPRSCEQSVTVILDILLC